ncbi:branched-chain amino acid ABC transporter substrate-binding protein [Rhizobium sp. RU36D]|uniref:branched-chain amino acid ABC transporter substrate-binding protein n=1 Tax=Rhizobium sp. RU36D TaxID=1907415 RepID=UPI0009D8F637|nr:branched-chain amino acid ABC transporter substrate-binding protein [Rhizobium sp. RU36D]SMC81675.1 amino acid/amide ABC transporter substrate-binding protein, HAAT family [Rhizobium sp. RU36D]
MSYIVRLCLSLAAAALPATADAASIGLVAPKTGAYETLGKQMADGAMAAAADLGTEITWIDETCEPGSGPAIAEALKQSGVKTAIGFLCSESLEASLPLLQQAGIPAITISVRAPILMEDALKFSWPFYRMAPSNGAEAAKLIEVMLRDWPGSAFALIEDGTIRGRELVEAIRNALEERGMKPAFLDTYRPGQEQQVALVRRLKKAGVTKVFIGGDRNDVAIIARDAAAENITLDLLGGDSLHAANQPIPLADGVKAVTLPAYNTQAPATAVAAALEAKAIIPEGYVLPAYAATQVAAKAVANTVSAEESLKTETFDTVLGPIAFGADHELRDNPYRLLEWRGTVFLPLAQGTQ